MIRDQSRKTPPPEETFPSYGMGLGEKKPQARILQPANVSPVTVRSSSAAGRRWKLSPTSTRQPSLSRLPPVSPGCHAQSMTSCKLFVAAASLALVCSLPGSAQDKGFWRAASNNAHAITGDISLSDARVTINFFSYPIAQIRTLNSAEVAAVFDADSSAGANGWLYRLNIPAEKRLLNKNTLCGTADTQWMATYVAGRNLYVAFFSGDNAPVFTFDAIASSTDLCGTFTYGR